MAEQNPVYVTTFTCKGCGKSLKSPRPLRLGMATVQCPLCGFRFQVDQPEEPAARVKQTRKIRIPPALKKLAGTTPPSVGDTRGAETPAPVPPRPRRPTLPEVPGYTILEEVGRGGMGVVYKARHEKLKRVVALKMVLAPPEKGQRDRSRFAAEAESVARLHHPNIVQIFEVGEHDGYPWLALEFVEGGTLKQHLRGQQQPLRASAQLLEVLARTIHVAHLRGIVHRDLKPTNILLALANPHEEEEAATEPHQATQLYGIPRITDFGLAKQMDAERVMTQFGEVLGTPAYMAPEQARGHNPEVGPAVDVYSLGAILYEMLTGRPPFQADNVFDLLQLATNSPPTPPRQLRPEIPRALEAICLKCLEKDPYKRYHTAQALADDLRRFLNGDATRALPPSRLARLWTWYLRYPIPASLLLIVALVLVFGMRYLDQFAREFIHSRAEKDAEQQTWMLRETLKCYSENVVKHARDAGLEPTHDFRGKSGGIPFPVAFTIELSEQFKKNADIATEIRVYSDYPFRFRGPPGTDHLDEWEKEALEKLRAHPSDPVRSFTTYKKLASLRYATALKMTSECVACHNSHPESTKKDWQEGDVRGVIEVIRPLAADLEEANQKLTGAHIFLGGAAVVLLTLSGVLLVASRRRRS
jgi:serine/threonine protein kinase